MTIKTSAEDYYDAIKEAGAGSLYYLMFRNKEKTEVILEPLIIDTRNEIQTINILKRTMSHPDFIAFPGTPEFFSFNKELVVDPKSTDK